MSDYEMKDNTGTLFVNDKGDNDKRPDRSGDAMIDGVMYKMSGWINTSKTGNPYLSVKFSRKDEVQNGGMAQVKQVIQPMTIEEMDTDIPF